jgi:hypothetical protein
VANKLFPSFWNERRAAESGREPDASKRTPRRAGQDRCGLVTGRSRARPRGREVSIASDEASAWMLCAAFALAGKDGIPMNHLPRALGVVTGMNSIEGWNDDPRCTKQEVLDALDAAIERVEGADSE